MDATLRLLTYALRDMMLTPPTPLGAKVHTNAHPNFQALLAVQGIATPGQIPGVPHTTLGPEHTLTTAQYKRVYSTRHAKTTIRLIITQITTMFAFTPPFTLVLIVFPKSQEQTPAPGIQYAQELDNTAPTTICASLIKSLSVVPPPNTSIL